MISAHLSPTRWSRYVSTMCHLHHGYSMHEYWASWIHLCIGMGVLHNGTHNRHIATTGL
jgi:hypothetical protein